MNLAQLQKNWMDTENSHKHIHELFTELVNKDDKLRTHRDFIENGYGFGERSFHYLWKLICDEQKQGFSFLEIGVYKSAVLSLVKLLRPDATVHGVTPLTSEGGYNEDDYEKDIVDLHSHFGLDMPNIIKGLSNEAWVIQAVRDLGKWNVVYIDGDHSYEGCISDLRNYAPLVKQRGYLVMDDANVDLNLWWGAFRGHQSVTDAKIEWWKSQTDFEFVTSVVHISVFRRI